MAVRGDPGEKVTQGWQMDLVVGGEEWARTGPPRLSLCTGALSRSVPSWEDSGPHLQGAQYLLLGLSGNLITQERPPPPFLALMKETLSQVDRLLGVSGNYYSVIFKHLTLAISIYKYTSGNVVKVTFRNRRSYSNNSSQGVSNGANSGSQLSSFLC